MARNRLGIDRACSTHLGAAVSVHRLLCIVPYHASAQIFLQVVPRPLARSPHHTKCPFVLSSSWFLSNPFSTTTLNLFYHSATFMYIFCGVTFSTDTYFGMFSTSLISARERTIKLLSPSMYIFMYVGMPSSGTKSAQMRVFTFIAVPNLVSPSGRNTPADRCSQFVALMMKPGRCLCSPKTSVRNCRCYCRFCLKKKSPGWRRTQGHVRSV